MSRICVIITIKASSFLALCMVMNKSKKKRDIKTDCSKTKVNLNKIHSYMAYLPLQSMNILLKVYLGKGQYFYNEWPEITT